MAPAVVPRIVGPFLRQQQETIVIPNAPSLARRTALGAVRAIGFIGLAIGSSLAHAQAPVTTCDAAGIGATALEADGPPVSILSVCPRPLQGPCRTAW
jgi:hypothetical protein